MTMPHENTNQMNQAVNVPEVIPEPQVREMVTAVLRDAQVTLNQLTPEQIGSMVQLFIFVMEVELGASAETTTPMIKAISNLNAALTIPEKLPGGDGVPSDADAKFQNIVNKATMRLGVHMLARFRDFMLDMQQTRQDVQAEIAANLPSNS
jgi:hypothetical protein